MIPKSHADSFNFIRSGVIALPIKNDISDRMIVERGIRSTSTASIASGESADERKNVITAFMASAMTASITMSMPDSLLCDTAMFPSISDYMVFCQNIMSGQKAWDAVKNMKETFEIEGLVDIGVIGNFIQCITGNFDSRYFNSLKGNEYTIVKSSSNEQFKALQNPSRYLYEIDFLPLFIALFKL